MSANARLARPQPVAPLRPRPAGDAERDAFLADVLTGLSATPKRLAPKWFYDERGSHLFEEITRAAEYYPTRTETRILTDHAADISRFVPAGAALVEFGAGSLTKTRILLAASDVGVYVPVDISADFLTREAARLRDDRPGLSVVPVVADFTKPFALPPTVRGRPRVGFFPGSTIGNFEPHEANAFLSGAARLLGSGATMIVGVDLDKDVHVLERAYDDADGITAEFDLNLLRRMNRELGATFDTTTFRHRARYDVAKMRIEMHLESRVAQHVRIAGRTIVFAAGETIHTENSYKYTIDGFRALAQEAGWRHAAVWTDVDAMFSVHALTAV